ncbi:MAG: BMP family ABC transporter substrate-binding protein [Meiothermus sp.]|uniref:BMP family lipoprotein n=1 Tax=Meiothermus sp. TaxID=1955249 RepID=UPI0025D8C745|nr:BMP family ABC transporter substrate-binding protein [Meiothermus sp.]MCS7193814.1 BMP family ABC transporter substrate-binding protein [Meiothermus sp.]
MKKALYTVLLGLGLGLAQPLGNVAMVFSEGAKTDPTFNGVAYGGALRAVQQFGGRLFDFEPTNPSQIPEAVRRFAAERFDLIIGLGFATEPGVAAAAREFREQRFALIDTATEAPNVASYVFRENEGTFLVGYIAGRLSQTGVVGFVGGMDIPLIHKFEVGYREGVRRACPACRVVVSYVGNTPAAFSDPAKAKEIAAFQRSQGADIIYAAAGASGLGVFDYVKQVKCLKASELPRGLRFRSNPFARVPKYEAYNRECAGETRPMFFIGGDGNLNFLGDTDSNPATLNHGLTCMLKRVDVAAQMAVEAVARGTFRGGLVSLGLKENGLGYALDLYNQALIPESLRRELEAVRQAIIAGRIVVPDKR